MHFQFDVSTASFPTLQSAPTSGIPDLLSQMLEVEREQLAQLRTFVASHDGGDSISRWRWWRVFLSAVKTAAPRGTVAGQGFLDNRKRGVADVEASELDLGDVVHDAPNASHRSGSNRHCS